MGVFFQDGGFVMFPTLFIGLALIAAAVQSWFRPERLRTAVAMAGLTFVSGMLGTAMGLINTMRYVAGHASQAEAGQIAAMGIAESLNNVVLSGMLLALACIALTVTTLRHPRAA